MTDEPIRLFSDFDLGRTLEAVSEQMQHEIDLLGDNEILSEDADKLALAFAEKYQVVPLRLDETHMTQDHSRLSLDPEVLENRLRIGLSLPEDGGGHRIRVYIPVTGDLKLLRCRPSQWSAAPPYVVVKDGEIVLSYDCVDLGDRVVEQGLQRDLSRIRSWLSWVSHDVERFNQSFQLRARERIDARRRVAVETGRFLGKIGIPERRGPVLGQPQSEVKHVGPANRAANRVASDPFDVLLAYNSDDRDSVTKLAIALSQRNLRPWFDVWDLPPGRLFQEEIELVLPAIRAAAVFVGPSGVGPWQRVEIRAVISQFVRRGLPVIPVLLPGVGKEPRLPLLLQEFSWVRFDGEGGDAEAMERLVWGIELRRHRTSKGAT